MINPTEPNFEKLSTLLRKHPELFEKINPKKWRESEVLYRDGESDVIEVEGQAYRFSWEGVEEGEE
jgi:hypothetical protein